MTDHRVSRINKRDKLNRKDWLHSFSMNKTINSEAMFPVSTSHETSNHYKLTFKLDRIDKLIIEPEKSVGGVA